MINFEYGGFTFEYNEFQHELVVICDDEELLLDAPNFDLGKMPEIYELLNNCIKYNYHVHKLGEVLDNLRDEHVSPQKIEETEEVYEFLRVQASCKLDELEGLLGRL